jgi:alkylhydroperoxidase family enzyme
VPDVDYEAAAEFDQKQLADLTIAIGLINAYNRMAISAWRVRLARARAMGRVG